MPGSSLAWEHLVQYRLIPIVSFVPVDFNSSNVGGLGSGVLKPTIFFRAKPKNFKSSLAIYLLS